MTKNVKMTLVGRATALRASETQVEHEEDDEDRHRARTQSSLDLAGVLADEARLLES